MQSNKSEKSVERPGRFSLNKPQVSILKKSTVQLQKRPASLGHSSAVSRDASDSNVRNSYQKKRLSWGKSKVLEFYKDDGKND